MKVAGANLTLAVAGGRIAAVSPPEPGGAGWVTPAFVDAHVHCTQAGLALDGLALHGTRSLGDALDAVAAYARARPGAVVLGTGWDETRWPERRPPTAAELERAAGAGALVYLARVDVHSAVASPALLAGCGLGGDGLVSLDDHHAVRKVALGHLAPSQVLGAQHRALVDAAFRGVARVHEMSGPEVAGEADLASLLAAAPEVGVEVEAWWGALGDVETPLRHGCAGAGGDLFCDGSFGSRTAALSAPYADDPSTRGSLRYDAEQVAEHVALAVRAGLGTGFHVIGDAAVDAVLDGYEKSGADLRTGVEHRLEHVEMVSPDAVERMARLGLVASVQPAFDDEWGGPDGMYAARLGERWRGLNPYAAFAAAGVRMRFGSDAPVTPVDPWRMVRAAVRHRTESSRVPAGVAFSAATGDARLAVGEPATFAVWDAEPDLETPPRCLRTVVRGRTIWEAEGG